MLIAMKDVAEDNEYFPVWPEVLEMVHMSWGDCLRCEGERLSLWRWRTHELWRLIQSSKAQGFDTDEPREWGVESNPRCVL